jgi:hypothetical protein
MEQQQTTAPAGTGQQQDLVKHALRFGAIMGGVSVVLTLLLYAVDYTLLADWKAGLLFIALFIGLVIYGGINYRNQTGGYITYGKAFLHGYITMLTGAVISTIFSILLYTVIDPALPQNLADAAIEKTEEMMRSFGAPEDAIDQQMEQLRVDMPKRFSAVGLLTQLGWGLIIYAVISAITSLFVKKNEPELM